MISRDYARTGFAALERIRDAARALDLTPEQARCAMPNPVSFMAQPMDLPAAVIRRIEEVEAVSRMVDRMFPYPEERDIWLNGEHQLSDIVGRTPIDLIVSGDDADLALLRAHLGFWLATPETETEGTHARRAA